ncbi:hypothetical protein KN63_01925 [Smithella sp. F21]|nr:hypothetical protein KN63_01925 [Smithella sp. F21]
MKKKIIILTAFIFLLTSCAPRYVIKYDVPKSQNNQTKIAKYKLGVLLFNDERPKSETKGSSENRFPDRSFEKSIPENIQNLIVQHFQAKLGNEGNVVSLKYCSKEISEELLNEFNRNGINLVLTGNIQHYKVTMKDDFFALRMVVACILGLTFVGMVLFPFIFIGNAQETVSIDFEKVTLFDVNESKILYQSEYKNEVQKDFPLVGSTDEVIEFFAESTKTVIEKMYNELEKSAEYEFPEQISAEKTKKIIKIKYN